MYSRIERGPSRDKSFYKHTHKEKQRGYSKAEKDGTRQVGIVDKDGVDLLARIQNNENLLQNMTEIDAKLYKEFNSRKQYLPRGEARCCSLPRP